MSDNPWQDDDSWWHHQDELMQQLEEEERIDACNRAIDDVKVCNCLSLSDNIVRRTWSNAGLDAFSAHFSRSAMTRASHFASNSRCTDSTNLSSLDAVWRDA